MPKPPYWPEGGLPPGADLGPDEPVITPAPKPKPRPMPKDLTKIEPDDATAPVKPKRKYAQGGAVKGWGKARGARKAKIV